MFQLSLLFLTTCSKEQTEQDRKEDFISSMLNDINSDSLEAQTAWLQDMGTRFTLAKNRRNVAIRIRNRFRRMGYEEAGLDSFMITKTFRNVQYTQTQYNVIAVIRGSEYPDSLCILGGHYDNYTSTGDPFEYAPGAHDNASGTAAVIEVARVMKKHNFSPSRSIMFVAFGAEELGLFGSKDLASDPGEYSGKISFMLNNDMIAYEPDDDPASWKVNIIDYDNSHMLRRDAEQIALRFTGLSYKNDNKYSHASDSYPFFLNGYKALFFYSGKEDPYYHTQDDLVSNCNFDYCREITKISCALLVDRNY